MKRADPSGGNSDVGFQIAPMIDVVFVILVFFMVLAGQARVEYELKIKLPGDAAESESAESQEIPDELIINIDDKGQVSINESEVDKPTDKKLPNLFNELRLLRQNAERAKTKLLVTVSSDKVTAYERIVLVLDTMTAAGASENVTFSVGEGD